MSPRKTNMLEAFRASDEQPAQPEQRPSPRAPRPAPRPKPARLGAAGAAWSERAPVFLVATLIALGLLGGSFWLGRVSVRSDLSLQGGEGTLLASSPQPDRWNFPAPGDEAALLAAPAGDAGTSAGAARSTEDLDAEGRTADDRSFYDKTNRFTVRAIYYGNTTKGWKRALAAYRYLRGQGLPAIAPIDQGDILVLCIGAEPRREGRLAELSDRLRALPGPPPQHEAGAFAGAYFVNIDDLVERD